MVSGYCNNYAQGKDIYMRCMYSNEASEGGTLYIHKSVALYIVESEEQTRVEHANYTLVSAVNISKCKLSRNRAQINGGVASFWKSIVSISAS